MRTTQQIFVIFVRLLFCTFCFRRENFDINADGDHYAAANASGTNQEAVGAAKKRARNGRDSKQINVDPLVNSAHHIANTSLLQEYQVASNGKKVARNRKESMYNWFGYVINADLRVSKTIKLGESDAFLDHTKLLRDRLDAIYSTSEQLTNADRHALIMIRTASSYQYWSTLYIIPCAMLCLIAFNFRKEQTTRITLVKFADEIEWVEYECVEADEAKNDPFYISSLPSVQLSDPIWQDHLWKLNSSVSVEDVDAMSMLNKSWTRRWCMLAWKKDGTGLMLYYYSEKDDSLKPVGSVQAERLSEVPSFTLASMSPDDSEALLVDMYGYDVAFNVIGTQNFNDLRHVYESKLPEQLYPLILDPSLASQKVFAVDSKRGRKKFFRTVTRALEDFKPEKMTVERSPRRCRLGSIEKW